MYLSFEHCNITTTTLFRTLKVKRLPSLRDPDESFAQQVTFLRLGVSDGVIQLLAYLLLQVEKTFLIIIAVTSIVPYESH